MGRALLDGHVDRELIKFVLTDVHPAFRPLLEGGFRRLSAAYPRANLDRVELFAPDEDDLSIGNVDEPGVVRLSQRWFSVPPAVLQTAARTAPLFHGPLTRQPAQVIAHEFGHSLLDGLGKGAQERNLRAWDRATRDQKLAPGPYALAAGGNEYFPELFAAAQLGVITEPQRAVLEYIAPEVIRRLEDER